MGREVLRVSHALGTRKLCNINSDSLVFLCSLYSKWNPFTQFSWASALQFIWSAFNFHHAIGSIVHSRADSGKRWTDTLQWTVNLALYKACCPPISWRTKVLSFILILGSFKRVGVYAAWWLNPSLKLGERI